MNYAAAVAADFFNERGLLKEYRPPLIQQQIGSMNIMRTVLINAIHILEDGVEIQPNTSTSVSDSVPDPVPSPHFPFLEFPLMEVVNQSQIDFSRISDTLDPRENSNSLKEAPPSTDLTLKSKEIQASHEEMREFRDLTVSAKHTQSTRDSSTISISDNSTPRKSISGTKIGSLTALQVETNISFNTEGEMHPETQLSNNRSVMPNDVQALTVLQDLLSDDFQMKNTHSTQRSYYKTYKSHSKYILRIESNSINSTIRNRLLLQFIHFRKVLLKAEAFHSLTRLPETIFYMKRSTRILQFYILQGYPYRKEILHLEGKKIFEYFQSSCSTHPCMLQDLPKAFQTFRTFSHSRQNSTYFRTSRDSTLLQHSLTRMHILHISWFPQKTPPSTS